VIVTIPSTHRSTFALLILLVRAPSRSRRLLRAVPGAMTPILLTGAEVLTHREMMRRTARLLDRRPPLILKVPVLSPRLSSYWVSLVTPVRAALR
jgi:hypothetical protein